MKEYPFKDVPDLAAFYRTVPDARRASRLLPWRDQSAFARQYNVNLRSARGIADRSEIIRDHVSRPFVCDCVVPEGLRWHKVDRGEPVTFSIDLTNAPNLGFDYLSAIQTAFSTYWPLHSKITFKLVPRGLGDIHIAWDAIDGQGGTLGFAYMPASGDRMGIAEWAGDIIIDMNEFITRNDFITILAHEIGHAIGIDHLIEPDNLMNAIFAGYRAELGEQDRIEDALRYGLPAIDIGSMLSLQHA